MPRYGYMVTYEIDAPSHDDAWEAMCQLRIPNGWGFVTPMPAGNIRELEPTEIPQPPPRKL